MLHVQRQKHSHEIVFFLLIFISKSLETRWQTIIFKLWSMSSTIFLLFVIITNLIRVQFGL